MAVSVPVPENEHPGGRPPACAGTVKVTEVSCDPETVPARVELTTPSPGTISSGPVTAVPVCAATHDLSGICRSGLLAVVSVPVQVPARLSVGEGAGDGAGAAADGVVVTADGAVGESPLPHAAVRLPRPAGVPRERSVL